MNKKLIIENKLNANEIQAHLLNLGPKFLDNLEKKTDVWKYSLKLASKSKINTINIDEKIAALLAYYHNDETKTIFISHIGVLPDWRKYGFASELISEIFKKYPDLRIRLEVSRENFPAIALYEKLGFRIYETIGSTTYLERSKDARSERF